MTAYPRTCPRCSTTFHAVTQRGICPTCALFSVIRADGSFVATRPLFTAREDDDEPFCDGPLGDVYAAISYGGAPLVAACRYDGYPTPDVCHFQLRQAFQQLAKLLEDEIPNAQCDVVTDPSSDPDWAGTAYESALELHTLSWDDQGHCIDLVCSLTNEGGEIDLLRDGMKSFDANAAEYRF